MRYIARIVHNTASNIPDEVLPDTYATTALADEAAHAEVHRLYVAGVSARYLILDEDGNGVDDFGSALPYRPHRT